MRGKIIPRFQREGSYIWYCPRAGLSLDLLGVSLLHIEGDSLHFDRSL